MAGGRRSGRCCGTEAGVGAEPLEYVLDLLFDGADSDLELLGGLGVGVSVGDEADDLVLAVGEASEQGVGELGRSVVDPPVSFRASTLLGRYFFNSAPHQGISPSWRASYRV
jgi:hypothetical protein